MVEGRRRRFLVPEVVQTSAMDCGPAALVAMLAGFDLPASYGRLREACHTDVDGTSIDTIEDIAGLLGLDAVQVMAPVDHVALGAADLLPAIVVTRLADRFNHFMVAWRRVGRYVQVMDPAVGRRWIRVERFERDLFLHRFSVPVDAWLAWAHSPELLDVLGAQLGRLGVTEPAAAALIDPAVASGSWEAMAALDAAVRVAVEVAAGRQLKGAGALVEGLAASPGSIPERYWFAWPGTADDVELRGAVLVRVRGPAPDPVPVEELSPDVAAVVTGGRPRPNREVLELLRTDGWLQPLLLLVAVVVAAVGTVAEGVLLRQVLDRPAVGVPVALIALAGGLLVLELAIGVGTLRLGRKIELGLRRRLLGVLPRLPDAYLRTRPQSDMAERAHHVHQVHTLPEVGAIAVGAAAQLVCMVVGIAVLDPAGWWLALIAGVSAVAIPLLAVPSLAERDLRLRTQAGALARFLVDALLGLVPLRAHAAEAAVRAEHGRQLDEWTAAGRALFRTAVSADALSAVVRPRHGDRARRHPSGRPAGSRLAPPRRLLGGVPACPGPGPRARLSPLPGYPQRDAPAGGAAGRRPRRSARHTGAARTGGTGRHPVPRRAAGHRWPRGPGGRRAHHRARRARRRRRAVGRRQVLAGGFVARLAASVGGGGAGRRAASGGRPSDRHPLDHRVGRARGAALEHVRASQRPLRQRRPRPDRPPSRR